MCERPSGEGAGVEIGVTGDDLRYWQAKEALRQAELRLAAQTDARRAFETRVTALLGWVIAASSIVAGAALAGKSQGVAAYILVGALTVAAALCVCVVWPGWWGNTGHHPKVILDTTLGSELEIIEALALGYGEAIDRNEQWLTRARLLSRLVYVFCGLGVASGAVSLFVFGA